MSDPLGFERFDQHRDWQCSGHDDEGSFTIQRLGDQWLLKRDQLVVVGDQFRDLVAADGGLARKPSRQGFEPSLGANLLRRLGSLNAAETAEILATRESVRAGRPARDVDIEIGGFPVTLGVDGETGIWTWLKTAGSSVSVDDLKLSPDSAPEFALLSLVPEIDFSHREQATTALVPLVDAMREASGLDVEVLYQDDETGEFRLLLLNGEVQALIDRSHSGTSSRQAVFGGVQHRWETDDWSYHVDTANPDHLWSRPIVKALERL